jgi:regulator of PEP synthase PpsR (kinase-PPPase family)
MAGKHKPYKIYIVSDGTGRTAETALTAGTNCGTLSI